MFVARVARVPHEVALAVVEDGGAEDLRVVERTGRADREHGLSAVLTRPVHAIVAGRQADPAQAAVRVEVRGVPHAVSIALAEDAGARRPPLVKRAGPADVEDRPAGGAAANFLEL